MDAMKVYYERKENIKCVALDDNGRWAVVGENNFTSTSSIFDFIKEAINKYGKLHSVSLTNSGAILVCCEKGALWRGIPQNLNNKLKEIPWAGIKYIKFTDSGKYIITDGKDFAYYSL